MIRLNSSLSICLSESGHYRTLPNLYICVWSWPLTGATSTAFRLLDGCEFFIVGLGMRARACVCVCVRACMRACDRESGEQLSTRDNNVSTYLVLSLRFNTILRQHFMKKGQPFFTY